MVFFACIMAGAIGAGMAAGAMPNQAVHGTLNIIFGVIGGTIAFAATTELLQLAPGVSVFLQFVLISAIAGALVTLASGSLRNIMRDSH